MERFQWDAFKWGHMLVSTLSNSSSSEHVHCRAIQGSLDELLDTVLCCAQAAGGLRVTVSEAAENLGETARANARAPAPARGCATEHSSTAQLYSHACLARVLRHHRCTGLHLRPVLCGTLNVACAAKWLVGGGGIPYSHSVQLH